MASEDLYLLSRSEIKELTGWNDIIVDDYLAISESVEAVVRPEGLHIIGDDNEPPFENGFVAVSGKTVPGFYLDGSGRVWLEGSFQTGISGAVAFTLPNAYKRDVTAYYPCVGSSGTPDSMCKVSANGEVSLVYPGTHIQIDGISFRAEG